MDKIKVLATYIESGMGHITSIQAIVDSIHKRNNDNIDLIESYIMKGDIESEQYEKFLTKQVQNTNSSRWFGKFMFGFLDLCGGQRFMRLVNASIFKKATDATINQLLKHNPDIIISTHYYITYCAIQYKRKYNANCQLITYNPDNNTHCWWDGREGMFLVNTPMAKDEAIKRNFDPKNIFEVGCTIRQTLINTTGTKAYYRNKFNLPSKKFTVIIADGAYAMAKAQPFTDELIKTDKEITILFIAGKNEAMYNKMLAIKRSLQFRGKKNITLEVYRFMPNIHELYKAADVFITKGGPNSICDCIYMGTPVIVNFCPQPMEKAAYKYFCKTLKCGQGVFKKKEILGVVENLIDNPEKIEAYKTNIARFKSTINGSDQIARYICTVADNMSSNRDFVLQPEQIKKIVLEYNPFDYEEKHETEECKLRHTS